MEKFNSFELLHRSIRSTAVEGGSPHFSKLHMHQIDRFDQIDWIRLSGNPALRKFLGVIQKVRNSGGVGGGYAPILWQAVTKNVRGGGVRLL